MVRFFILGLATTLLIPSVSPAQKITTGDTVFVQDATVRESASVLSDAKFSLERGDHVVVRSVEDNYYKISKSGRRGWLSHRAVMTDEELREYRQERTRKRKKKRERREYLQSLREKGYSIMLRSQSLSVNSADGVSLRLRLQNISESKTVKYATIEWQLFNTVGDPTAGQNGTPPMTSTRFVGPLKPGETGGVEFENVWYSSVGRCAVIRKIEVEHVDGSAFTYVNDLEDIIRYADGVRLSGDCTYKAQELRKVSNPN